MKYLIWLLVILLVIWAVKRNRRVDNAGSKKSTPLESPSNMVTCAHCGIHLPQDEAIMGEKGLYCSAEHRSNAQDRNPA